MDNQQDPCVLVLERLRHVASTRGRYTPHTIAEIAKATALRRLVIAQVLGTLRGAGYVSMTPNPSGDVGRELWRATTDAEIHEHETRRALARAIGEARGEQDPSYSLEISVTDLAVLLRLPSEQREQILALVKNYTTAVDAEWCPDGNTKAPATYDRPWEGQTMR